MGSEAEDLIRKARIKFLYENPFFANLSMYLELRENKSVGSMGIDFKGTLLYNPEWVCKLTFDELKGVIAHETLHLAFEHLLRLGNREQFLWNVSCDFAINNILVGQNFTLPDGVLIDREFIGMTAEQIYDKIYKDMKRYGGLKTIDVHIYPKIDGFGEGKNDKKEGIGVEGLGEGVYITERELKEHKDLWKKRLVEATTLAKQMGKLPMGIERLVDGLLDSKINWRGLLYRYITQEIPYDLSYSRPHKKSISVGIYMPYVVKENIDIVVAVDTSGSISQKELTEFLSEILTISKSFSVMRMTIIVCDCEIKNVYELDNNDFDLNKIKIHGYGGTDFRPVFRWIEKNKPTTKLLIYFTDGEGEYPSSETVKTLWILPRDYNVPFGEKIVFGEG